MSNKNGEKREERKGKRINYLGLKNNKGVSYTRATVSFFLLREDFHFFDFFPFFFFFFNEPKK